MIARDLSISDSQVDDYYDPAFSNMVIGNQYTGGLFVGQAVHSTLYGGRDGYIKSIEGQQTPNTIRSFAGGAIVMGGSAQITIRFDSGIESKVPESIVRGIQWYISSEYADQDAIDYKYYESIAKKEELKQRKEREEAIVRQRLPGDYPHLETAKQYKERTGKEPYSWELAISNLRKDLKVNYPGVKFSVTHKGSAIRVSWSGGPDFAEVNNLARKFEDHQPDYTGDFMDYNPTVFNKLFGGETYVFLTRD